MRELGGDMHAEITTDDAVGAEDRFLRFELRYTGDIKRLALAIEAAAPGIEIQSVGHSLEIVKDAGGAAEVDARHHISKFRGSHGLGHVRLATESITAVAVRPPVLGRAVPRRLDRPQRADHELLHAPPPADRARVPLPDRQRLRADRGLPGRQDVERGQTFYEALKDSVYELDGCFAYLLSMPDVIGSAKDMFAIKSIVVANVDGDIAMATEEQAIRAVYTGELETSSIPTRAPSSSGSGPGACCRRSYG